jgi:hypothetical protein
MIRPNTRKRSHAISIDGKVADRYFAVTSEVPRNTVETRISVMPRNGRSARAGAAGAPGFFAGEDFSDEDTGTRSSLAAAADGGVTEQTRAKVKAIEADENPTNDKRCRSTRTENRQRICAIASGDLPLKQLVKNRVFAGAQRALQHRQARRFGAARKRVVERRQIIVAQVQIPGACIVGGVFQ